MVRFAAPLGQGFVRSGPRYLVPTSAFSLLKALRAKTPPAASMPNGPEEGAVLAELDHKRLSVSSASRRQGFLWQSEEGRRTGLEAATSGGSRGDRTYDTLSASQVVDGPPAKLLLNVGTPSGRNDGVDLVSEFGQAGRISSSQADVETRDAYAKGGSRQATGASVTP
jgi:hypothetical protein